MNSFLDEKISDQFIHPLIQDQNYIASKMSAGKDAD